MMRYFKYLIEKNAHLLMERNIRRRIVTVLSCVIVLTTACLLVFPAVSLEKTKSIEGMNRGAESVEVQSVTEKEEQDRLEDPEPASSEELYTSDYQTEEEAEDNPMTSYEESEEPYLDGTQTVYGQNYTITAEVPESALIPRDAFLSVDEITNEEYETFYAQALEALGAEAVPFARFFDIRFERETEEGRIEVCPQDTVRIVIDTGREVSEEETPIVLHYKDAENAEASEYLSEDNMSDEVRSVAEEEKSSDLKDLTDGPSEPADPSEESQIEDREPALSDSEGEKSRSESVNGEDSSEQSSGLPENLPDTGEPEVLLSECNSSEITFDTDSFSVFGVIYAVDFRFSVDGKEYVCEIPGGGVISLEHLIDALGVTDEQFKLSEPEEDGTEADHSDTRDNGEETGFFVAGEVSAAAREFTANVADVQFSDPDSVWVGRVDAESTVGRIKEEYGLEGICSEDVGPDQIAQTDAEALEAGDWLLISLRPLSAEECLTITMNNGEVFSIFVTDTRVIKRSINAGGNNFNVTVVYDNLAGIPENAELTAVEIVRKSEEDGHGSGLYDEYVAKAGNALGMEEESFGYIRLFDIAIVDENGEKIQPAEGRSVDVRIELADKDTGSLSVVHFADDAEACEVIGNVEVTEPETPEGAMSVSFAASGFSVYAVVDDPQDPYMPEAEKVTTIEELDGNLSEGFLLAVKNNTVYVTSELSANGQNCLKEVSDPGSAAVWYFEKDASGKYYIYTLDNGTKQYIKQISANSNNGISLDSSGTPFVLEEVNGGKFYLKHANQTRYLQHSNGGGGIRFYTGTGDPGNSQFTLTVASSVNIPTDPYGLDGKTTGIVNATESLYCTALMADSGSVSAEDLPLLSTKGYADTLYVLPDSEITEWTFHAVEEDKYHITAQVDGEEKYLAIRNGSVVLADEPEAGSLIKVQPGTGNNRGTYSYSVGGTYLALDNTAGARSFYATNDSSQKIWLNFAEKDSLSDDDYLIYTAKKINVSDPAEQVVLYTRVWNGSRYEFYAVNHDGSLIPCYDDGDVIKWLGNQYETAVWELTDYYNQDEHGNNTTPNGYYELQNTYSGQYLAPQLEDGGIVSDSKVGLNLDGRYYQENSTTVKCWDDYYYSYVGMKVDLENMRVVPCPSSQADTFFFARIKQPHINLTEVRTIDNDDYGIKMRMIDFNNDIKNKNGASASPANGGRDVKQTDFFGFDSRNEGLLSTGVGEDGYPVAVHNGQSLHNLFTEEETVKVDQLFLSSVYEESGYFEFDSTKNYAYLNPVDNEFEVYDQLGTIERDGNRDSMKHGQFMPYNSLINPRTGEPWQYSDMYTNTTNMLLAPLSEEDPRYNEGLHEIPRAEADYFFGMEMEAQFTQTKSGKDAWGNDIIFEFSGDDDFWFYVDDELVLDLGGVPLMGAKAGTVNFRTGIVTARDGSTRTLRQIFTNNYKSRNPGWTQSELNDYLDRFFEDGGTVFKDFSVHTMKVYYMERGAGASNLYMRFNLTAVKAGEVTLSKKVSGSQDVDYDLMEFPYQILYKTMGDSEYQLLTQDAEDPAVTYAGSKRPVEFRTSFTPAGETQAYQNVFFLKAGEEASITMPVDIVDYKIVECGVNMNIFREVKVNGEKLSDDAHTGRHDYETAPAAIEDRPKVEYENVVDPDSLRTLTATKTLWDEHGFTVENEGTPQETRVGNKLYGYDDDSTTFSFRISMSAQGSDEVSYVRNKPYYVKDRDMNYCRWNPEEQKFVSLGISEYSDLEQYISGLSGTEKAMVIFETSPFGGIDKIPAGFSIEMRGLPVDSSFKVEERDNSIPPGYTRVEYERDKGSYMSHDEDAQNEGIIRASEDPHIIVHNQRGWGLTVNKVWTDADYMESHDDIYIAIYVKGELLEGSIRKIESPDTSVYYYLEELLPDASFNDYEIREVELHNPYTDEDGNITAHNIKEIEEGGTLKIGGTPIGEDYQHNIRYDVSYEKGELIGVYGNVREDTVTNSRRGIKLVKTDWNGDVLPDAVFTLSDSEGNPVGKGTYTSDQDGLITIAYLDAGQYTLEEITVPNGFRKPNPWTIIKNHNDAVRVEGDSGTYEITPETEDEMMIITLKNKGFSLQAVKTDEDDDRITLQGAVFALYKQVSTVSGLVRDQRAMPGYEELTTGSDGEIPKITSALGAGTYYLSEVTPPAGYKELPGDLVFTINSEGVVTIPETVVSADQPSVIIMNNLEGMDVSQWISSTENDGNMNYKITIPNEKAGVPVRIVKTDQTAEPIEGVSFILSGETLDDDIDCESRMETSVIGDKEVAEAVIYKNPAMAVGTYTLTETECPAGYIKPEGPIEITIGNGADGISVDVTIDGQENPFVKAERIDINHPEYGWRVTVINSVGAELPATGGSGTGIFTIPGLILSVLAGWLLYMRHSAVRRNCG